MGLMYAKYPHPEPIERAVKLVMSRQQSVRTLLLLGKSRCFRAHSRFHAGRFVGAGSDRGDVQPDSRHLISELQVLVYDLDAGQGG